MNRLGGHVGLGVGVVLVAWLFACGDDDSGSVQDDRADGGDGPMSGADSGMEDPVEPFDRTQYTDVGVDEALDYSDMGMWACHPDHPANACHANLDATEIKADGSRKVVPHVRASDPEFDCFYVYPTVLLTDTPNMVDFSQAGIDLVNDPLLSQAARFNRMCEVYAPLYRQFGLFNGMLAEGADRELGYEDVRDAFQYYLENDNQGRKFVLIGHSQGSFALEALIEMDIDNVPEVRERMLSAVLLGGRMEIPSGERVGGSFENIPTCQDSGETGCVIGYVTFDSDTPPGDNTRFGITETEGNEIICTNPAELAGNSGSLAGSYYPLALNNPGFRSQGSQPPEGIETPFVLYREVFNSRCVSDNGVSYLELSTDLEAGDPQLPPYHSPIEAAGWGLHLTDFNNALEDLLVTVEKQAEAGL